MTVDREMNSPSYNLAALVASKAQSTYNVVAKGFRDGTIDETVFIAAHRARAIAEAAFDDAFIAERDRTSVG